MIRAFLRCHEHDLLFATGASNVVGRVNPIDFRVAVLFVAFLFGTIVSSQPSGLLAEIRAIRDRYRAGGRSRVMATGI
jgi:hypothetical protein